MVFEISSEWLHPTGSNSLPNLFFIGIYIIIIIIIINKDAYVQLQIK